MTLCRHNLPPIADILYILQCLIPGLLTTDLAGNAPGQGNFTTSRKLPPVEWVDANRDKLLAIFGTRHYTHCKVQKTKVRSARGCADGLGTCQSVEVLVFSS